MSAILGKHMDAAEQLIASRIDSMCMAWDHSFGLMDEQKRDALRRNFRQIAYHDLTPFIAAALANAECEGMKRAAEIIRDGVERPVSVAFRMDGKPSKNDKCPHDFYVYEDCEECCVAAILSEAGEVA